MSIGYLNQDFRHSSKLVIATRVLFWLLNNVQWQTTPLQIAKQLSVLFDIIIAIFSICEGIRLLTH